MPVLHCGVQKPSTSSAPFSAAPGIRRMKMVVMVVAVVVAAAAAAVVVVVRGGCAWWEACIWVLWSTQLQHLGASVWGSARVLGVSPKGSVGCGMRVLGVIENWAGKCVCLI